MARKHRRRKRRELQLPPRVQPGAAPGTLNVDSSSPRPAIRVVAYSPDHCVEEDVPDPGALQPYFDRWPVVWVNVDGLGDAEVLQSLARQFQLHRLAIEDVVNLPQRAKAEPYDEHLFVILRMPTGGEAAATEQVSMFLGERFVLTFQERGGDCFDPVRKRIREGKGRIRRLGTDYLAYALIDAVVDGYFPVLDEIADQLDRLEAEVLGATEKATIDRIQRLKGEIRALRQAARPHRDLLTTLLHEDTPFVSEATRVYIRDALDHAVQVAELIDSYRDSGADLMGAYLSSVSNRMNEVMKVLTIIAAIFIPLSFIAGLYGMNFNPKPRPGTCPS
jgi:magnesium transporter